ncbi:hypothetical protein [Pseudomonas aeruginosa]|uniref:hypothetical protein n=1 Tax=Pseudomonas aeruginosa TaxID=287 RepID=UPI0015E40EB6|nr:hypothetical protein [Pseudomonas aeruginosa]MBA1286586.1 hypothetical protein [Pseudomonas aeruginosa]
MSNEFINKANYTRVARLAVLLLVSLPVFAFADSIDREIAASESFEYRIALISMMLNVLDKYSIFMGVLLFILAGLKMKQASDEHKPFPKLGVGVYFVAATFFFNSYLAYELVSVWKIEGDESICFMADDAGVNDSCYSDEVSELSGELAERVGKLSGDSVKDDFMNNFRAIIGLFQVIGVIYFMVGIYGLVQVSNGSKDGGYGKPIITMISSALIIDLPHTASMFLDTLQKVGVNF